MNLSDPVCPVHGWLAHVAAHEAGHATAAVLLGIPFVEVVIYPLGSDSAPTSTLGAIAGGVDMGTVDPTTWVPARPEDSLTMLVAGTIAETQVLGHEIPKGFIGDVDQWKRGMLAHDPLSKEEMRARGAAATRDARELLATHASALAGVVELLLEGLPRDSFGHAGLPDVIARPHSAIAEVVRAGGPAPLT